MDEASTICISFSILPSKISLNRHFKLAHDIKYLFFTKVLNNYYKPVQKSRKKNVRYQFSVKITNISYFWGGCCHKMHDKKWLKEEVFILSWRQQTIRAGSHVSRHLRNIELTCRALWSCLLLLYRISTHGMLPVTIKMIFFNFNLPAGLICVFVAVIKHWPNTWIWNSLFHITFLQHNEYLRVSKARTQYRNMGKGTEAETVEE